MARKNVWIAAALAALLALPAVVAAAPQAAVEEGGFNARAILANPRALARYLRLTPAQVQQQKALLQGLEAEVEPLRQQQRALREDLREALAGAAPDACSVGAIVVEVDALGDDVRAAIAEFDDAFSAILGAEQLARYEALKVLAGHGD